MMLAGLFLENILETFGVRLAFCDASCLVGQCEATILSGPMTSGGRTYASWRSFYRVVGSLIDTFG
jgi:hypothetical protein